MSDMTTHPNHLADWLPTAWSARLQRAEQRGYFSHAEVKLAANWGQCAIGERRHAVGLGRLDPKEAAKRDRSDPQVDAGLQFFWAVTQNDVATAREVYNVIQLLVTPAPDETVVDQAERLLRAVPVVEPDHGV